MKKFILAILLIFTFTSTTIAQDGFDYSDYKVDNSPESFINAPSAEDLDKIIDPDLRYCEEIFLKAYMRRDFSEEENNKCRELFAMRIEAEMNYKKQAMQNRGIY